MELTSRIYNSIGQMPLCIDLTDEHLMCHRVTSLSNNLTGVPVTHPGSSVCTLSFMAGWSVNSSIQMISVEVLTSNELGQAKSDTFNFTLGDIGTEAAGHPLITLSSPSLRDRAPQRLQQVSCPLTLFLLMKLAGDIREG